MTYARVRRDIMWEKVRELQDKIICLKRKTNNKELLDKLEYFFKRSSRFPNDIEIMDEYVHNIEKEINK